MDSSILGTLKVLQTVAEGRAVSSGNLAPRQRGATLPSPPGKESCINTKMYFPRGNRGKDNRGGLRTASLIVQNVIVSAFFTQCSQVCEEAGGMPGHVPGCLSLSCLGGSRCVAHVTWPFSPPRSEHP